jgi:hypothetical protein
LVVTVLHYNEDTWAQLLGHCELGQSLEA